MELIKKISLKTLIAFTIAFIAILAFHFSVDVTTVDYKYFSIYAKGLYEEGDVLSFLQWRYATWTSRLPLELLTFWFVLLPTWAFAIADSVVMLAIVVMTYLLFSKRAGTIYAVAAILITFMFKITDMGSSGYLVAAFVYTWPLATFLLTLFPFKRYLETGETAQWPTYIVGAICAIYGCSCEQVCVATIMTWGMFVLFTYWQSKKINYLYCFLLLIAFANLVIIGICPGNAARTLSEMHYVNGYENYTFFKKVVISIATPITRYMVTEYHSLIVWAFSLILPLTLFLKNKNAYIPLFVSIIPFLMLCSTLVFKHEFVYLQNVSASRMACISIASIIFYASILFALLYIVKDKESIVAKYGPTYIFLVGFATRACLGFTISFPEATRTYFLLEYAMIAISILFVTQQISEWKSNSKAENN